MPRHIALIIDHPSLVSLRSRLGWSCVTVVFWAVWIYLWMPFLTLLAWSLGFYQAYNQFHWEREVMELKRLIGLYSIIIAAFGSSLLLWALSEYVRFRHKRRRSAPMQTQAQELAEHINLSTEEVATWQALRCMVAYHDDHGGLIGADSFVDESCCG